MVPEIVIQKAEFPTDHHIFLVHEKSLWNEDIIIELDKLNELNKELNFNVLLIDELDKFSNHCFSLIADVGEEIVYGTP